MRHCTFCGTELPEQAQFCGYCGRLSALSGKWPQQRVVASSTWPSQDEPTAISNTSLPTLINEQTVLHSQPQQEKPTLLTPSASSIWTSPLPQQASEEEQDRARRAMVWGIPLSGADAQKLSGAPVVQGTPQVNGAPSLRGTPPPQMVGQGRNTPPPYQQPPHATYFAQNINAKTHTKSSAGASAAKSAAMQWVIVVITAVIVLTTAGVGVALAVSPSLSLDGLSGNRLVAPGQRFSLHGSGFLPGGHVTFKRDNNQSVQIAAQSIPPTAGNLSSTISSHLPALSALSLASSPGGSVTVSAAGTFDASLLVDNNWGQGDHTVHATEDIFSRSATILVIVDAAPPALSVTPNTLKFGSVQKGTKTSLSLAVGNSGGKPLTWTADSGQTKWLKLQSTTGDVLPYGGPQSITVSCDTTSLAPGTYSSAIHVHTDAGNADINVSLQVVAQKLPTLAVSTASLDFQTMDAGQQATKVVSISNTGTLELDWQITSNQAWASLDQASGSIKPGGASQGVNVQVDTTALQPGSYSATLTIGSNGGTTQVIIFVVVPAPPPQIPTATPTIPPPTATPVPPTVTPTVPAQGHICALPSTLDFGTVQQGKAAAQSLTLGNCGGTSFTWTAKSGNTWITIDKSGGTLDPHNATVNINVTVDTTSLKGASSYSGTVTFYTSAGDQTVNITVTVAQPLSKPASTQTPASAA